MSDVDSTAPRAAAPSLAAEEVYLLLAEMSEGSVSAFERFYDSYISLVYQVAYRITGDRMEAEDVCHDVFLEVFRKAGQFDAGRGSIEAWLAVRTKSRCLDRLRRRGKLQTEAWSEAAASQAANAPTPEENVVALLQREALLNALEQIPSSQRNAVYGAYLGNCTHKELAEKMHQPLGTVKSLIRYGIKSMRKVLDQSGWLEPSGGVKKNE